MGKREGPGLSEKERKALIKEQETRPQAWSTLYYLLSSGARLTILVVYRFGPGVRDFVRESVREGRSNDDCSASNRDELYL